MQSNAQEPGFSVTFNEGPSAPVRSFVQRRRNRHGRGLRGPLLLPGMPAARTRSEKFEDLVVDSAERLSELWSAQLADVEYLVEEVPDNLEALIASGAQAPLGKYSAAVPSGSISATTHPLIVIYRHPVEALCDSPGQVRELIHEVLIEQVAGLLNIDPDSVDPLFGRFRHGGT
ncbi:metallopeptidase family protein [Arthrobacter livingstonensis]|nr:metallopeptidase family protein [Arthrobacter livingstonensis]